MRFVTAAIAIASVGLGFSSPFIAGGLLPIDALDRHGLLYFWFYGIPAEVLAVSPLQDVDALLASIGVFMVQYVSLFTALVGATALVRWTFSGQSQPN